jgi:predicted GTPase
MRRPRLKPDRVIIMGAAGRDFHNFNVFYKDNPYYDVVAFTAAQIPDIAGRKYPAKLAGKLYPKGIPIFPESELESLIKKHDVHQVIFAYSDVSHEYVMHRASAAIHAGADFRLLGIHHTILESQKPVISVCALRTGSGKSQTTRRIAEILKARGKRAVIIRHPMPYGDLVKQRVQRFATEKDLVKNKCTIEEREEYEGHIERGNVVYAGVDYEAIIRQAEKEADFILWDGGNNDFSFYKSALYIVVADPLRAEQVVSYHPGEINARLADVVVINKENSASADEIRRTLEKVRSVNPACTFIHADSVISVDGDIAGKRVAVVEDGPSTTHGGLGYGAGFVAAMQANAEIVDPRPFANGSLKKVYAEFPHIERVIPAMGYSPQQRKELETTINRMSVDMVVSGTPINIGRVVKVKKPVVRVRYDLKEKSRPTLEDIIVKKFGL